MNTHYNIFEFCYKSQIMISNFYFLGKYKYVLLISRGVFDLNDFIRLKVFSSYNNIHDKILYLYRKFLDLLDLTDNTFEKIVKSNYIEC